MKRFFNLIEIVLAMAVLAVGMTGVMALFPVGFKANNESVETNNAVLVANKIYSIIKAAKSMNPTTPWKDRPWFLNSTIPPLPTHRFGTQMADTNAHEALSHIKGGTPYLSNKPLTVSSGVDPFGLYAVGNSAKGTSGTPYPGLIFAKTGVVDASSGDILLPSFTAHIRLWQYPVFRGKMKATPLRWGITSDRWEKGWDSGRKCELFKRDEIVGVYMEVSWPATIPWKERTYRYFYFELYKNN